MMLSVMLMGVGGGELGWWWWWCFKCSVYGGVGGRQETLK